MVQAIRQKLKDSPAARWTILGLVSLTMLTGYIISDVMAPLQTMLEQQLGWDVGQYGLFTSGYGWINIFLLMLIFGGMILDRRGPRFTGLLAVGLMMAGTTMKFWAVSTDFAGATIFGFDAQVIWAALGFGIAAAGIEMIGITANKIVVKWFTGRSLALALGINVAAGRIGTFLALTYSRPIASHFGSVAAPLALCLMALCIGLLTFLIFTMMDRRADAQNVVEKKKEVAEEEQFKISDIGRIASIRGFWYITILCVLFYSAVFPFLKYATDLMIQKFHVDSSLAGLIPGLLPFGNILLTPLFGSIYDRRGRGATIMIIGAVLLVAVHLLFSVPSLTEPWMAVVLIVLLGAAFSLVPSAMWPSVPKIIPYRMLGTAYSMIFWIQNWGLSFVPLIIGWVLDKYCRTGGTILVDGAQATSYDYTLPMMLFAMFGVASVIFAMLLRHEDRRKGYGLEQPNIKR